MDKLYCTLKDIARALPMDALLSSAKGDARETDALAYARIEQGIAKASKDIEGILNREYLNMLDIAPGVLTEACVYMAAAYASDRQRPHYAAPDCLCYNRASILEGLHKLACHRIDINPEEGKNDRRN